MNHERKFLIGPNHLLFSSGKSSSPWRSEHRLHFDTKPNWFERLGELYPISTKLVDKWSCLYEYFPPQLLIISPNKPCPQRMLPGVWHANAQTQIHNDSVYTNTVNDETSVNLMKCYIFGKHWVQGCAKLCSQVSDMHIHKRKNMNTNTNLNTKGAKRCRKVPMPKAAVRCRCRKVSKGAEDQAHVFKFGCHPLWGVVHSGIDTLSSIHETNQGR